MRKRNPKKQEGISYWQSQSDMLTGLILVLLLIIVLLVLFLTKYPHGILGLEENAGSTEAATESVTVGETEENQNEADEFHDPWPGAGNGEDATAGDTYQQDTAGGGGGSGTSQTSGGGGGGDNPGTGEGDGEKTAVHVTLVDGETKRNIQEAGVDFSLYTESGNLQTLNTYYPQRITYSDFDTTENGTFYLPEKIVEGSYYFKDLTEATGYDLADDTHFTVDTYYDWNEPFEVQIEAMPSKNIIRIQTQAAGTGENVGGAVYTITAAEDIVTMDGTTRYTAGQEAGTITTDDTGYGESDELYLGKYTVTMTTQPAYYALNDDPVSCTVEKKTGSDPQLHTVEVEKTGVTLVLADELTGDAIEGAEFTVSGGADGGTQTLTTGRDGKITLDQVSAGTVYTFHQESAVGDYRMTGGDVTVTVDGNGRIDGAAAVEETVTNRLLRVSVGVKDYLFHQQVSDRSMSLYTADQAVISTWTTSGSDRILTDLAPGTYYVTLGRSDEMHEITVTDTAGVQDLTLRIWTARDVATVAGIAGAGLLGLYLLVRLLRMLLARRKQKKQEEEKKSGESGTGKKKRRQRRTSRRKPK